jgi:hypothetical protein
MKSEDFVKKLENVKGFYGLKPISNTAGFSFLKDLPNDKKDYTSLLIFSISDNEKDNIKNVIAYARYGRKAKEGVYIREDDESKLSDPLDIFSKDEYFYDTETDKFFKNKKEISLMGLIDDFYSTHIKTTKFWEGLLPRLKLFFWKIIISNFLKATSLFFTLLLRLVNGDKYSYKPIGKTEVLNNVIISSTFSDLIGLNEKNGFKEEDKPAEKLEFLGYKGNFWPIFFYSAIHLIIYTICYFLNYKPDIIVKIFENNFLTLAYVILSLCFIEKIIPNTLKLLIKNCSEKSFYFAHIKEIKI